MISFCGSFHLHGSWSDWCERPQSCPTLCDPIDYRVHGILQASILDWVAFPFSRGSSKPRDQTQVSRILGRFLPHCRQILHQLSYQGSFCQFFNVQFFSTSCHHITVRHNHSWLWIHRVFFFSVFVVLLLCLLHNTFASTLSCLSSWINRYVPIYIWPSRKPSL